MKVLIVDDNRDSADSLSMLTEIDGHVSRVAYSGEEALKAAREFLPDVMFLDIGLPDKDGYQVATEIRRNPATAHIRLVAMTGWGTDKDKERAKAAGFEFHLTKPVDLNHVQRILSNSPGNPDHGDRAQVIH